MALDTTMSGAISASALRVFTAVEVAFISTSTTIHVIDGSGVVTFSVDGTATTFTGSDPVFGALAGVTSVQERVASEAPTVSISLMALSVDAFGEINNPVSQGSPVRIWWGLVDDQTGDVIGAPELLWTGRLDYVQSHISDGSQVCEIVTVSAFDRLFSADEGEALCKTWHQSIWAGETGLDYNVAAKSEPYWGADAPAVPALATVEYALNYRGMLRPGYQP